MSIQLFIGHSGQRLALDSTVTSLDGLRAWVAQHAGIQARSQVLLTAQGKQVRQQTLLTETELFVFDSKLFASKEPVSLPGVDALDEVTPYNPGTPPDTIANQNDLQAWQTLFRSRKSWASALLGGCSKLATQTEHPILLYSCVVGIKSLLSQIRPNLSRSNHRQYLQKSIK